MGERFDEIPAESKHCIDPVYSQIIKGQKANYAFRAVVKKGGHEAVYKVESTEGHTMYTCRIHKMKSTAYSYLDMLERVGNGTNRHGSLEWALDYGEMKLPAKVEWYHYIISMIHDGPVMDWFTAGPGARLDSNIRPTVNLLFTEQIYSALDFLSEKGVSHNNIAAENVVLAQHRCQVIIIDFNVATTVPEKRSTSTSAQVARHTPLDSDVFAATELIMQFYLGRTMGGNDDAAIAAVSAYLTNERQCVGAAAVAQQAYDDFRPGRGYSSPIIGLNKYPEHCPDTRGISDHVDEDHSAAMQFLLEFEFLHPAPSGIAVAKELRGIFQLGYLLEGSITNLVPRIKQIKDKLDQHLPVPDQQKQLAIKAIRETT